MIDTEPVMNQAEFANFVEVFQRRRAVEFATVSSCALLLYDYGVSFPNEVNLVWFSPWTSVKITFLLNRYLSVIFSLAFTIMMLMENPTVAICEASYDLQAWSTWFCVLLVQILLQIWIKAVFQMSRRKRMLLAILCFLMAIGSAMALVVGLRRIRLELAMPSCILLAAKDTKSVLEQLPYLMLPRLPTSMLASLIPSVTFVLCLLALLAQRSFEHHQKVKGHVFRGRSSAVSGVLSRDAAIYFVTAFCVYILNALVWTFAPSQIFQMFVGFGVAIPSILGSRILLNLRGVNVQDLEVLSGGPCRVSTTRASEQIVTPIVFASEHDTLLSGDGVTISPTREECSILSPVSPSQRSDFSGFA